jgi:cytochrome b561
MPGQLRFPFFSRLLHWLMAVLVLPMLFIGIGMVALFPTTTGWSQSIDRSVF